MRVLEAGASSVLGPPVLRELRTRGHEPVGITRAASKRELIEQAGAEVIVADVGPGAGQAHAPGVVQASPLQS